MKYTPLVLELSPPRLGHTKVLSQYPKVFVHFFQQHFQARELILHENSVMYQQLSTRVLLYTYLNVPHIDRPIKTTSTNVISVTHQTQRFYGRQYVQLLQKLNFVIRLYINKTPNLYRCVASTCPDLMGISII